MSSKILGINENFSFKSTTSILSSYQSSVCSLSQGVQSTASLCTTDYVQNTIIITIDASSYSHTTITFPEPEASPPPDNEIRNSNCASDSYCTSNLNEIKDLLSELQSTLDTIDTSGATQCPIDSKNSSDLEESTTVSPSITSTQYPLDIDDASSFALTPVKSNKSFIIKAATDCLPTITPPTQCNKQTQCKKQRSKNPPKSIVDLYTYYNYEWKRFKRPGEDAHMKERWKVHTKFFKLK